ncbi:hypothetical protein BHE74_00033865 [Ensete ventricosum]|nr:hypothetical protein GW17_00029142 [Ensete ventricosum]RWW59213.1 hypothetical protein BHE74_00033865 [Ensete ventricosum]
MDNALTLLSSDEIEALEKIQVLFSNEAIEHKEEARSVETTPAPCVDLSGGRDGATLLSLLSLAKGCQQASVCHGNPSEDFAFLGILRRGDGPTPPRRASGGSRCTPSVSANKGLPPAVMESVSAPAPTSFVGAEVPQKLLPISQAGPLLRGPDPTASLGSELVLEPLEEATYE